MSDQKISHEQEVTVERTEQSNFWETYFFFPLENIARQKAMLSEIQPSGTQGQEAKDLYDNNYNNFKNKVLSDSFWNHIRDIHRADDGKKADVLLNSLLDIVAMSRQGNVEPQNLLVEGARIGERLVMDYMGIDESQIEVERISTRIGERLVMDCTEINQSEIEVEQQENTTTE